MASLMYLCVLLLALVALPDSGSAALCSNPDSYKGKIVSNPWGSRRGESESFVQTCTGDHRPTTLWKKGSQVKGSNLPKGTAIATFPNGKYRGHAAVYVSQDKVGIQVWDQWVGPGWDPYVRPVSQRNIRWEGGSLSTDGNSFYVVQ